MISTNLSGRLQGRLAALEPLSREHEEALLTAARDREVFAWLPQAIGEPSEAMHRWVADAIEAAELGREVPFAIVEAATGSPIGSTRFMEIRPEHRRVEIGWTWLAPRAWRARPGNPPTTR